MLTMKDIIREGHPTLRKVAQEVELPLSDEDKTTLHKMLEYLINSQDEEIAQKYQLRPGVGLAAPQINISKRLIAVLTYDQNNNLHKYRLINPKIISHSVEQTYLMQGEGCLSVDREVPGFVIRPKRITVSAYNLQDDDTVVPIKLKLTGYIAIVFQHEIDHLNGILFMDHINKDNPFYVPDGVKPIDFNEK